MGRVKTLSLHFKQLTSVPTELGTFAALEKLNLDNNQLTSVPAGLDRYYNVRVLGTMLPYEVASNVRRAYCRPRHQHHHALVPGFVS